MDEALSADSTEYTLLAAPAQREARVYGLINAGIHTLIGITMLTLPFLTSSGVLIKGIEVVLSLAMLVASWIMWSELMLNPRQTAGMVLLAGEIALAAAFLYLGVAIPAYHQGHTTPIIALAQFLTVLLGLLFGCGTLALAGAIRSARPKGVLSLSAMVRDGVQLITGTVVLGIALSQAALSRLTVPQWNWISFLGITIPGMLLLVAREGVKESAERARGLLRLPYQLAIEIMLVIGLSIMLYGSYVNLTLGANGYRVGIKGNTAGLTLWLLAALLLIGLRGAFKLAFSKRGAELWYRLLEKLLYVILLVPFIYGIRSVFTGQPPRVHIGAAGPAAAVILFGAFLILVIGRAVGQKIEIADADR